ncbi:MAG: hypothetical protein VXY13_07970 [Pseudomonadota bacterium]|nr:hypothetical protein [Pseudomonadota bacterium]
MSFHRPCPTPPVICTHCSRFPELLGSQSVLAGFGPQDVLSPDDTSPPADQLLKRSEMGAVVLT